MQPADTTIDETLLARARRGDRQAHAVLYRAFAPMVYTVAFRMLGSRASAEDVLQDSFVEVIRKAGDFRGGAEIRGWIKRIAINKCLSQLRSPWIARRSSSPVESANSETALMAGARVAQPGGAGDEAHRLGRQQELERALATLSATARSVVWLHDVEGYTHKEIGRLMGRSTSFSKTQLSRAYSRLREFFEVEEPDEEAQPCLGVLKTV